VAAVWPDYTETLGDVALEMAAAAGLVPDAHQAGVIRHALGLRPDNKWAAFEVAVVEPRQNGKGGILEIRELVGIFEVGEAMIIHSAHEFATAMEAMQRMEGLLEESGFDKELKPKGGVQRAHGAEGFVFKGGRRLRYRTRTKGGGKGFTSDCLILDEAFELPAFKHGALMPTLSGRSLSSPSGVQIWYTSSAVDQNVHDDGVVLAGLRRRGWRGDKDKLAYFEWAALEDEGASPEDLDEDQLADRGLWAKANPALGIRIAEEFVEVEHTSMDSRTFAVERLGVGDWPPTELAAQQVIQTAAWDSLLDLKSRPLDPVCFAFDVSPARTSAAIAVAGTRADGLAHLELVDHRKGTGWISERLAELQEKHRPAMIVCDGRSPAAALLSSLEKAGVDVTTTSASEHAQACGLLFDLVEQRGLRHLGGPELRSALKGAKTRPLSEAWAWARTKSSADISPLVAATLAVWGTVAQDTPAFFAPELITA
jgi:hypothetical protein